MRPLVVCDFAHSLCTVKFEKEDAPLLTNYLYLWTFAFCLFQYERKKKQSGCLMILEFWSFFCFWLCNHQYHNLNFSFFCFFVFFLMLFLSSTFLIILQYIWKMSSLVYGLDICVCKEEMWESVQEDALFLLWNILSLLISKQELCLFLLLWLNACI